MGRYIIRRTLFAIPTLVVISLIIFAILDLAPVTPPDSSPSPSPPKSGRTFGRRSVSTTPS
jgi:peptide/nickel transport system permease protein